MLIEKSSTSYDQTREIGHYIAENLLRNHDFAALFGDLGAGKTALTTGIIEHFDPDACVASPTYSIVNEYRVGEKTIYHCDFYRITDPGQLYSIGFYDYLEEGIIISEWSENIADELPRDCLRITIKKDASDENKRYITVERED